MKAIIDRPLGRAFWGSSTLGLMINADFESNKLGSKLMQYLKWVNNSIVE